MRIRLTREHVYNGVTLPVGTVLGPDKIKPATAGFLIRKNVAVSIDPPRAIISETPPTLIATGQDAGE